MKNKIRARKPVHLKKKRDHKFSCMVGAPVYVTANLARTKTWPELTEEMLRLVAAGISVEAIVNTALILNASLNSAIKSEYEGTKTYDEHVAAAKVTTDFLERAAEAVRPGSRVKK